MAGVSGGGTRNLDKLMKGMSKVRSPGFRQTLLRQLSREALNQVMDSFMGQRDPYGTRWKPLKAPPPKRVGGMVLSDTGRLRNSFRASSDAQTFEVTSNVEYAAIHNYGGVIAVKAGQKTRLVVQRDRNTGRFLKGAKGRRVTRNYGGHSFPMPRRQFLPDQDRLGPIWTPAFQAIATAALARALGQKRAGH